VTSMTNLSTMISPADVSKTTTEDSEQTILHLKYLPNETFNGNCVSNKSFWVTMFPMNTFLVNMFPVKQFPA
jgi:hypothetical protein